MDKLRHLSIGPYFHNFIEQMKSGSMNPNLAWRIILLTGMIVAFIIGASAYSALNWAQDTNQAVVIPPRSGSTLSSQDLHDVVQFYELKESTYKSLHQNSPAAPKLGSVSSIQNTSTIVPSGNATTSTGS